MKSTELRAILEDVGKDHNVVIDLDGEFYEVEDVLVSYTDDQVILKPANVSQTKIVGG